MQRRRLFVATVAALMAFSASSRADPTVIKFAMTGPELSPGTVKIWRPWVNRVEKDSEGTLKIDIAFGSRLATIGNVYDRLVAGVFQIGYGNQGVVAGKFPGTTVTDLPFLADNAHDASGALWLLYQNGTLAKEYAETVPIALFTYTPSNIHTKNLVKTLADLKGMKIAASSDGDADLLKRFGAVPVSLPITEFYPASAQGVVGGVAVPWTGVMQFKLQEVLHYHLALSMGIQTGFLLMNKAAYEALSAKAKAAIQKNSGYEFSMLVGAAYDEIAATQYAAAAKSPGQTMNGITGSATAQWAELAQPQIDAWVSRTPDGAKILAAYRAALAKVRAAK
jgi:TRAP-type transport system periplasmic protein